MNLDIDCPCGSPLERGEGLGEEVNLTLQCSACGRGYVVTITQYEHPG